uniref:Uncharacterized protein n=1 Tax=Xiphophorus maculatus TaxID=8083 RepID=A0A3B5QJ52_XIPMA
MNRTFLSEGRKFCGKRLRFWLTRSRGTVLVRTSSCGFILEVGSIFPVFLSHPDPSRDLADSDPLSFRKHSVLIRRKRNLLFPSGVKLCSQETFDQAVSNHLHFFHLRGTVCFSFSCSLRA